MGTIVMADSYWRQSSAILHAIGITLAIALFSGYLQPQATPITTGQSHSVKPPQLSLIY